MLQTKASRRKSMAIGYVGTSNLVYAACLDHSVRLAGMASLEAKIMSGVANTLAPIFVEGTYWLGAMMTEARTSAQPEHLLDMSPWFHGLIAGRDIASNVVSLSSFTPSTPGPDGKSITTGQQQNPALCQKRLHITSLASHCSPIE
ncbi:hypothetical protein EJ03DRAFT_134220 [Teratosphaeria nubilosa]|uniref:Uncharacterized protein n=1 Tax=Teratosphaeria nubilosa TaxID=161662 RepID=A0A6G1L6B7_9PEZI|nr:hypothetical protein EJ03DRAFT_134220 [Teratosphaeria nubilosa]